MARLVLEFHGHIPAKKNSLRRVMRGGRLLTLPSKAYETWAAAELASLRNTPTVPGPISITYDYWIGGKDSPLLFDLDNSIASINDLRQKAEIIDGDDWATLSQASAQLMGFARGEQRTVVTIASVAAPWTPILATLRDGDALRALAKANGVSLKAQRDALWEQLHRIEVS